MPGHIRHPHTRQPVEEPPSRLLAGMSAGVVVLGALLPYTLVGRWLGFTALPFGLLLALAVTTALYLVLAQIVKRAFYRRHPAY